jgi:putative membrane protein
MLSEAERERVAQAVSDAETRTAGEIVVVVARAASGYRTVPAVSALLAALATPWPLIAATALSASRIFLLQLAVALIVAAVLSLPRMRLALVPAFVKRARGREAAAREFVARGLTRTRGRTGVLIYVAEAERYAEVIADTGIATQVDEGVWRETIEELVAALRESRGADGLAAAVARVGAILAEHAPRQADDADELPNRVILI